MRHTQSGHQFQYSSSMKDHATSVVSDEAFAKRKETFPVDTPDTKEAYFIREIFQGEYGPDRISVFGFPGLLY